MKDKAGGDGFCFLGFIFGFGRTLRKICTTIKLIGKTIRLEMIPTSTYTDGVKTEKRTMSFFYSSVKLINSLYRILVTI